VASRSALVVLLIASAAVVVVFPRCFVIAVIDLVILMLVDGAAGWALAVPYRSLRSSWWQHSSASALQWCTPTTAASGISPLQRHCTPRTVAAAR
jgi:hypothetical protein